MPTFGPGIVHSVLVSNRTLTPAEIQQLHDELREESLSAIAEYAREVLIVEFIWRERDGK